MKKMSAHGKYEIADIMEITDTMEQEISRGVIRQNRTENELAFILTGAYASDLIHRGRNGMELTLAPDESEQMFRAVMTGYFGNLFCGQYAPQEVHEMARKMLSSYLMFWAWNVYDSMRREEQFVMRMQLKMGNDPVNGTPGVTVQQIILRDIKDPAMTYTFDAAKTALDCVNTICPIAVDDGEEDEESEGCAVLGAFGCSPAAFRCRIMQELYGAFPERLEEWLTKHEHDLKPDEALAG